MKPITKLTLPIILLLTSVIIFHSCKKNDKTTVTTKTDIYTKSVNALKENNKGQENMVIYGVTGRWKIDMSPYLNKNITQRTNNTCYTPGIDEYYVLSVINRRQFLCGTGYKIFVEWKLSVPNAINLVNNNGTYTSTGRVRLKNSSGTTISTSNVTAITFTTTGSDPDPDYPDNKIISITYETPYISQSTYGSAVTLENSMPIVATDCTDLSWFAITNVSTYTFNVANSNTTPCQRNDLVYINPTSYSGSCDPANIQYLPSIGGCNILGQCSISGYTLPQYQDVQWRKVDASGNALEAWHNHTLTPTDVFVLTASTYIPYVPHDFDPCGRYEFHYRNNASTPCNLEWSPSVYYNL